MPRPLHRRPRIRYRGRLRPGQGATLVGPLRFGGLFKRVSLDLAIVLYLQRAKRLAPRLVGRARRRNRWRNGHQRRAYWFNA